MLVSEEKLELIIVKREFYNFINGNPMINTITNNTND